MWLTLAYNATAQAAKITVHTAKVSMPVKEVFYSLKGLALLSCTASLSTSGAHKTATQSEQYNAYVLSMCNFLHDQKTHNTYRK